ncbi:hypothetical protein [Luteimonas salinilitoris]|uniref:Uncharacterized protein n=1 Tax=Luteimonas salinilitoris TaxID=3237697 RepID=A0ABV4HYM6_9GAMM
MNPEFGIFLCVVWFLVYIARACEAHERVMRVLEGQPGREIIALGAVSVPALLSERIGTEAREAASTIPVAVWHG